MITTIERQKLKRSAKIQAVAIGIAGFACMLTQSLFGTIVGIALLGLAILWGAKGAEYGEMFVVRQRAQMLERAKKFGEDKQGIVWVWIVALLTWAIMAIAYFSLSMVVYIVLDQAEAFIPWGSAPAWADQYMQTITLTRNVAGWFLIIMTVGIIGWALINSARRTEDTGPAF